MAVYLEALAVLETPEPPLKMAAAHRLARNWGNDGNIGERPSIIPHSPARPELPQLIHPTDLPRRRLGTVRGRCALLHAVAHIEFNAINLAADMLCRFGPDPEIPETHRAEFISDWISVVDDEARHFGLICDRLAELGHAYGDYPAHNGLWEAATSTRHDISARLAIAPLVLEARGLDVTPNMIEKFERVGDRESAQILKVIYDDEIGHVAIGVKWFRFLAELRCEEPKAYFETLVRTYYKGILKPPFNHGAREKAGLPRDYYAYMG